MCVYIYSILLLVGSDAGVRGEGATPWGKAQEGQQATTPTGGKVVIHPPGLWGRQYRPILDHTLLCSIHLDGRPT